MTTTVNRRSASERLQCDIWNAPHRARRRGTLQNWLWNYLSRRYALITRNMIYDPSTSTHYHFAANAPFYGWQWAHALRGQRWTRQPRSAGMPGIYHDLRRSLSHVKPIIRTKKSLSPRCQSDAISPPFTFFAQSIALHATDFRDQGMDEPFSQHDMLHRSTLASAVRPLPSIKGCIAATKGKKVKVLVLGSDNHVSCNRAYRARQ